jgi:proline dehydrogenase
VQQRRFSGERILHGVCGVVSHAGHPNVGVCLQAYLYRTPKDIETLVPLGPAIRIAVRA